MKKIPLIIGLLAFFSPFFSWADEVMLKEGKVLTGTIVQEDKDEVGITLGEGMFLRIDRSNIQSIKRTSDAPPPAPVRKRDPSEPRTNAVSAPKAKQTPVQPSSDVTRSKKMAVEYVVIVESIIEKKAPFSGKKLTVAEDAIMAALKDTATDEARLKALYSKIDCVWHGKSAPSGGGFGWKDMEIVSTMTFIQAEWTPGPSPRRDETETWDQISLQLKNHDEKVLKNFEEALADAAQVMAALQSPSANDLKNETDVLLKERISRAEKKKRAIDRLTEAALLKIINK